MAREKGIFQVSANYEPLKAAPFDARMLVEAKADLIAESTWMNNSVAWVYNGMIVAVSSDVNSDNNGVYLLLDANNYTSESSWQKLANTADINKLQEQIDDIEVGGGGSDIQDIEVATESDLPEIGQKGVTYYVLEEGKIYRWQEETQSYISFGGEGSADLDINIIYGGNANGNTD